MKPLTPEEARIVEWLRDEDRRHPRTDYAAWCTYFLVKIESLAHRKD